MHCAIIGTDGLLGRALRMALENAGHRVTGTTRRPAASGDVFLDLSQDPARWPDISCETAFIAAGVTSQASCAQDPDQARSINVDQTLRLIEKLNDQGAHAVFPSTNIVLGCETPFQPVDAPLKPLGFYAGMKADVERALRDKPKCAVARLPKILDGKSGLLKTWREQQARGEKIRAFTNLKIAPVSLVYASKFIKKLMEKKLEGVWHISGGQEISYYDLACEIFGSSRVLADEMLENAAAASPRHPSLDCARTEDALHMKPQTLASLLTDCGFLQ